MNLSSVLRWGSIFACCVFLINACTHTREELTAVLSISSSKTMYVENDTVIFQLSANTKPVTAESWTASLGNINNTGRWIIPAHIYDDTIPATITASYKDRQHTIEVSIVKKALQQPAVSFTQTIQPLLTSNCNFNGCHANGSRAGKVELSCYDSVQNSVIPFHADASKLYFSLIKTDPLRIMPPAGKLHANKIQSVWLWIEQGARNN
ncbi:MAG: hypothetical protein V4590_10730 [Bacteroidota bacterium]